MARSSCAVVLLVLVVSGCGHRADAVRRGAKVFRGACGSCHTMVGHDTQIDGGDLGLGHLTLAQIESFTRTMAIRPPLTQAQLREVSLYVVERQRHFAHDR